MERRGRKAGRIPAPVPFRGVGIQPPPHAAEASLRGELGEGWGPGGTLRVLS